MCGAKQIGGDTTLAQNDRRWLARTFDINTSDRWHGRRRIVRSLQSERRRTNAAHKEYYAPEFEIACVTDFS